MALITRTLESADGTQQIAIFDTEKRPRGSELGIFFDKNGIEYIVPASKSGTIKLLGKLILIGKNCGVVYA